MKTIDSEKCPKCSSENLEWGSIEISLDEMSQEINCRDCNYSGYAIYDIKCTGFEEIK